MRILSVLTSGAAALILATAGIVGVPPASAATALCSPGYFCLYGQTDQGGYPLRHIGGSGPISVSGVRSVFNDGTDDPNDLVHVMFHWKWTDRWGNSDEGWTCAKQGAKKTTADNPPGNVYISYVQWVKACW